MRAFTVGWICVIALIGCDIGQFTQTKTTTEFVISLTNQPHPIIAGQSAKIYLTLRQNRGAASGCRTRMAIAPVHATQASADANWRDVPEQGRSGVYTLKDKLFPEPGDWRIDLIINCTGIDRKVDFTVTVAPPT